MSHSTCIGHKTWQWAFVSQCDILSVGPTSNVKPSRLKARKHIYVITLLLNSLSGEFRFSLLLIHAICKAYVCYRNLQNIIICHSCISFFVNFFIGQFLPCKGIDRPHLYTAIAMTEWSYTMYKRLETESLSFSLLTFIIPIESINWGLGQLLHYSTRQTQQTNSNNVFLSFELYSGCDVFCVLFVLNVQDDI